MVTAHSTSEARPDSASQLRARTLLLGAGHSNLFLLEDRVRRPQLYRDNDAILVSSEPYQYYSGLAPAYLGGSCELDDLRFDLSALCKRAGVRFLQDEVRHIERGLVRTAGGVHIGFDVASCNLGSGIPQGVLSTHAAGDSTVYRVKPISRLPLLRQSLDSRGGGEIAVVGGGPAGVETAANLARYAYLRGYPVQVQLFSAGEILSGWPEGLRRRARASLTERGVRLVTGTRVGEVAGGRVRLDTGPTYRYDLALLAIGIRPPQLFAESGLETGPSGGLAVDATLESLSVPGLFGAGDCIDFMPRPLAKVGVYAVRQAATLTHNVRAAAEGRPLRVFRPGPPYLFALNLGYPRGVARKFGVIWGGKPAWNLKHHFDTAFARRFKAYTET